MGKGSSIEWTDATFNIAWGCTKVSPGCQNCYADTWSRRYGHDVWGRGKPRRTFGEKHWNEPVRWARAWKASGEKRRMRVFCSSMADVFEDHPMIDVEREKLWTLIRNTPHVDWQLLTKRPERIVDRLPADWGHGYENVWIGTSIESEDYVGRIAELSAVPAAIRFISIEPLLGPIKRLPLKDIDWVILGGESGPGARPLEIEWARQIRDQCLNKKIPFFFKQWGGVNKKKAGRVLDGALWSQYPRGR